MPPMKIQPIGFGPGLNPELFVAESAKPAPKSRLKRLFDRPFPNVLKISSSTDKPVSDEEQPGRDAEFEPSSICLAKMVQNFIEENNEKQSAAKYVRNRCNCFNGNGNDSSDDELDGFGDSAGVGSSGDAYDALKGLVPCASVSERNLLADTAKIVEKNKNVKRKDELRKIVTENLSSLGYDSSICKSKWDKTSSFPAGEYEYIDVIVQGERLLIDIDFRSEFEIARSTGTYRAIIQSLPYIFVGKTDRLSQIVRIVSEAARQNLKKKGLHFPPWRKAEYMQAKWVSPYTRAGGDGGVPDRMAPDNQQGEQDTAYAIGGDFELIFGKETVSPSEPIREKRISPEWVDVVAAVQTWQPPPVRPKGAEKGAKVVTGLAFLLKERP